MYNVFNWESIKLGFFIAGGTCLTTWAVLALSTYLSGGV